MTEVLTHDDGSPVIERVRLQHITHPGAFYRSGLEYLVWLPRIWWKPWTWVQRKRWVSLPPKAGGYINYMQRPIPNLVDRRAHERMVHGRPLL